MKRYDVTYLKDFVHQLHQSPVVWRQAIVGIKLFFELRDIRAIISVAREAVDSLENR
jgi:hypothetical protein